MAKYNEETFKYMSDIDLIILRKKCADTPIPEDADFRLAILVELSRRVKSKGI